MIGDYIDAGLSKFVIRPATLPGGDGLERFVEEFVTEILPLQT
jgi:hypothetical protein